ncbi:MAG: GNAT family N-acetyltransferase [Rhodospirillales bacterium]|nr:GNAT family N-acetyltransferase [Rhodospirillales bacterium]
MASLASIAPLSSDHDRETFACGDEALDRFLKRHALGNQAANSSRTYVACRGRAVIGYYSLAVGSVQLDSASPRVRKGLARHPVPVMLLARLAVNRREQGLGLGQSLLKDAILRTLQAADIAGIRAMLVHAKDEAAKGWYERFDFEPSPTDPLHLFLLLKDARAIVG